MTITAYLLAVLAFGAWAWSDRRERGRRDAWWRDWHQARTWQVVPELYDWREHGL